MSAASSRDTDLAAKYRRVGSRGGRIKALVAVDHATRIAIFNMLTTGAYYEEPGGDFHVRLNPDKAKNRAVQPLRKMGYEVTLKPQPVAGYGNLGIRGRITPTDGVGDGEPACKRDSVRCPVAGTAGWSSI